jgi:rhodanese-related sulfurtransferase
MNDQPAPTVARPLPSRARSAFLEAACLAVIGGGLALIANQLSPRGLQLTRNYFPPPKATVGAAPGGLTNPTNAAVADRLLAKGLQTIARPAVEAMVRDVRYSQGHLLILDARNDQHYRTAHIPGALQFDHYRAEAHLATVIPACLAAEKIVVYCTGGACEDSEFAALMLREAGIPNERLFIYAGGIADWTAAGLPVEASHRFSGELKTSAP